MTLWVHGFLCGAAALTVVLLVAVAVLRGGDVRAAIRSRRQGRDRHDLSARSARSRHG